MTLLEMSFSGAVLTAAAALLRHFLGDRLPRELFPALWWLILLRLLIPFSLNCPFSVYASDGPAAMVPALFPEETAPTAAVRLEASVWSLIWAAGATLLAAWFLVAWFRWLRRFSAAEMVDTPFVRTWLTAHPLRRTVTVRRTAAVDVPLSRGLLRPVILLPARECTEEELGYVLEHELVHIRRLDQLTKLALAAALCVHWFNPLVWLMVRLAHRDLELSCDRTVLRRLGHQARAAYARTLLTLEAGRGAPASICSSFSQHPVEERICAIMKTRKISVMATVLALVLMAAMTMAFATSAAEPEVSVEKPVPVTVLAEGPEVWTWPVPGGTVSYTYGEHPNGFCDHICIADERGTEVLAALSGTVEAVGFDPEAGNYVVLAHENGLRTSYQHLQEPVVVVSETVSGGDRIGTLGATGMVTGPCLSFAVQAEGETVDPMDFYA